MTPADPPFDLDEDAPIYPMALFPRLLVDDVDESVGWYERMGFATVFRTAGMAHVRYRRHADVMLAEGPADDPETPRGAGVAVYVTPLDRSVAEVADLAREAGSSVDGPRETGHNTREVAVRDPNGYELVFSEPVDTDRSFEDVVGGGDARPPGRVDE